MNQTSENGKKPSFEPDFDQNPGCHFFFFFKNLASSVTRYHGQLSACTISEKYISEGHTDRQTHGWTDGWTSDFIGCCLTNVECSKRT